MRIPIRKYTCLDVIASNLDNVQSDNLGICDHRPTQSLLIDIEPVSNFSPKRTYLFKKDVCSVWKGNYLKLS